MRTLISRMYIVHAMKGVNTRGEACSKTGVVSSTTVQVRSAISMRSTPRKPSRP